MRKPTNNILSILGKPEALSQAEMEENLARVAEFLIEERERTRAGFNQSSTGPPPTTTATPGTQQVPTTPPPHQQTTTTPQPSSGPTTATQQPNPQPPNPHMASWSGGLQLISPSRLADMRGKLPALADMSDEFMLYTPLDYLLRLNEQGQMRERFEKSKSADDKLASNQDNMDFTWTLVESASDNRSSIISAARFLPGATKSGQEMWLLAREAIGKDGHIPVACYDMASCGLTGHVTSRGWIELHNPGSSALQLKLFNIRNKSTRVQNTRRFAISEDDALEVGESMRDIFDQGELKASFRALREAMAMALPWNRSVAALEGFLIANNWCQEELGSSTEGSAYLNAFIDHVLGLNAENWRRRQPFLSASELTGAWKVWHSGQLPSLRSLGIFKQPAQLPDQRQQAGQPGQSKRSRQRGRRGGQNGGGQSGGGGHHGGGQSSGGGQHGGGPNKAIQQAGQTPGLLAIGMSPSLSKKLLYCKRFNYNNCPNQANSCALPSGDKLQHLCDFRTAGSAMCGQPHARVLNH